MINFPRLINQLIEGGCIPSQSVMTGDGENVFYYRQKGQIRKVVFCQTPGRVRVLRRRLFRYKVLAEIVLTPELDSDGLAPLILQV